MCNISKVVGPIQHAFIDKTATGSKSEFIVNVMENPTKVQLFNIINTTNIRIFTRVKLPMFLILKRSFASQNISNKDRFAILQYVFCVFKLPTCSLYTPFVWFNKTQNVFVNFAALQNKLLISKSSLPFHRFV